MTEGKGRRPALSAAAIALLSLAALASAQTRSYVDPKTKRRGIEDFYKRRRTPNGSPAAPSRLRAIDAASRLPLSPLQGGPKSAPFSRGGRFFGSGALPTQTLTVPWTYPVHGGVVRDSFYGAPTTTSTVRATALVVDPTHPEIVYAGLAFSGLAKSLDSGAHWTYLTDGLPSQQIQSIAIDTTAPNIIYAGTGDNFYFGSSAFFQPSLSGVGVYRSLDSGATWTVLGTNMFSGQVVNKLAVDPRTSGSPTQTKLYAAVAGQTNQNDPGIFVSPNSGTTWIPIGTPHTAFDVVVDSTDPSIIYAMEDVGIVKMNSDGSNETVVMANPNGNLGKLTMVGSTLYATFGGGSFNSATYGSNAPCILVMSTDGGSTFNQLHGADGFCISQDVYNQYLGVDPVRPDRIFLGGIDPSSSTDGGNTFSAYGIQNFFNTGNGSALQIHVDQHAFAFAPSNTDVMYLGNDGGIWSSSDGGASWINDNADLPGMLMNSADVSADGAMAMGAQDNDNSRYNGDGGAWHLWVGSGDGTRSRIDQTNSQKMYGTNTSHSLFMTSNAGATFTEITPPDAVTGNEVGDIPFYLDPANSSHIILGYASAWESHDSGTSWVNVGVATSVLGGFGISALGVAPGNSNVIYAAKRYDPNSLEGVFLTTNAADGFSAKWVLVSSGATGGPLSDAFQLSSNITQEVTSIAVDPRSTSTVYVTLADFGTMDTPLSHVYKSTDAGHTWTNASAGLPDAPFNSIVIDTSAPSCLLAGSDVGVFNSIDGGNTWSNVSSGIPSGLIINELAFNAATRQLVAASYGRGAFNLTLPAPPPAPTGLASAVLGTSSISWTWAASPAQFNVQAYGVYYATNPTVLIAQTAGPSFIETGLAANTTYSIQVTAANGVLESANSVTISTFTLALPPTAFSPAIFLTNASGAVLQWTDPNPPITQYVTQASTDPAFQTPTNALTSGQHGPGAASFFHSGLAPDTTYFFRVQALSDGGVSTAFLGLGSTITYAAAPGVAAFINLTTGSLRAQWTANGNPSDTAYLIELSTMSNFNPLTAGTTVQALFADFNGLTPGTPYFARARANGKNGVNTTQTSLGSANTASLMVAGVALINPSTGSFTASWTLDAPSAEAPLVALSTDNFATVDSSRTLAVGTQSVGFGSPSLLANTSYYFKIKVSTAGDGAYVLASTATLALAAVSVGQSIPFADQGSVSLLWSNPNPSPTQFMVGISTNSSFAPPATSSIPVTVAANGIGALSQGGLSPDTTYFFQVQGANLNGIVTGVLSLGSTATYAAQPGAAGFVNVTTGSLRAQWTANGNPADTAYLIELSTAAGFAPLTASATVQAVSADFTGLSAGTLFFARVRANGKNGVATTPTSLGSTRTLPPTVTNIQLIGVTTGSFTASWTLDSPASESALVALSTDNFATVNSSRTLSLGAQSVGFGAPSLLANTTYFFKIKLSTAGDSNYLAASTATLALAPTAVSPGILLADQQSATLIWFNPNPSLTQFVVGVSTDPSFPPPLTSSGTTSASANSAPVNTQSGLAPNTTYFFQVQAVNVNGLGTAALSLGSTATYAAAPGAAPFVNVTSGSLRAQWTANGNPADTSYLVELSTMATFAPLMAAATVQAVFADFANLPAGAPFFAQVRANGKNGVPTSRVSLGGTNTGTPMVFNLALGGVSTGSLTATWSLDSPGAESPLVALSTDNFATVSASQTLAIGAQSVDFGTPSLLSNTTYFFKIKVSTANDFAYIVASTPTLASSPTAVGFGPVTTTSVPFAWKNPNPSTTTFVREISIDPGFASLLASGTVNAASNAVVADLFSGLAPNTTFFVRLRAFNDAGLPSPFLTYTASATLANPPSGSAAAGVTTSSVTLSWSSGGNPAGTHYLVQVSTNNFATIDISSRTDNLAATLNLADPAQLSVPSVPLVPNTTFFLHVQTLGHGGTTTQFDVSIATATDPLPPTVVSPEIVVVSTGTLRPRWGPGGAGPILANASDTAYFVELSTNASFAPSPLSMSATVQALSADFGGLAANTAYFARVRANGKNGSLAPGAGGVVLGSTPTFALAPNPALAASTFTSVDTNQAILSWSNPNPGPTAFVHSASTDGFKTVTSSITSAPAAPGDVSDVQLSLAPNATYFFQVAAVNPNGFISTPLSLGSTVTLALPPGASAYSNVGLSALTVNWTSAGNNPGGATLYQVDIAAVSDFSAILQSSFTFNTSLSTTTLTADTTYFARVLAINGSGHPTVFTNLGSTATAAAAPGAGPIINVTTGSLRAQWTANGNPADTAYLVELSTMATFVPPESSATVQALSADFASLPAGTRHFARVRANGKNGVSTAPTSLGSATTLTIMVFNLSLSGVSTGSFTAGWSLDVPAVEAPLVALSTDNFTTVNSSRTLAVGTQKLGFGSPSLLANTTYYFKVKVSTASDFGYVLASTPTLASSPTAVGFGPPTTTSLAFSWKNPNPSTTTFVRDIATDAGFVSSVSSGPLLVASNTVVSDSFTGLTPNTTFFIRLRAFNYAGVPSAFLTYAASATLANPPSGSAAGGVTSSGATLSWSSNADPAGTHYLAQISTDGFSSVNASSRTDNLSAAFGGLASNTTYFLRVQTIGHGGTATAFDGVGVSTATDPVAPVSAGPGVSAGAFPSGAGSTGTLSAFWTAGVNGGGPANPADTSYLVSMSTDATFPGPLTASTTVQATTASIAGLASNTLYFAEVRANGKNGSLVPGSGGALLGSTFTFAQAPLPAVAVATFTNVTFGQITLAWNNPNPTATTFIHAASTDNFATITSSITVAGGSPGDDGDSHAGLSPNVTYFFQVVAVNGAGQPTRALALGAVPTLALPPGAAPYSGVSSAAFTANWTTGGNDPGGPTLYRCDLAATASFAPVLQSSFTFNTFLSTSTLAPNAVYFARVLAINHAGIPTSFTSLGPQRTTASPPSGSAAAGVAIKTAALSWQANGNPPGTQYQADVDDDPAFGSVNDSSRTLNTSATLGLGTALAPNTVYFMHVKAFDASGNPTAFDVTVATTTLASAPGKPTFSAVFPTSMTVAWPSADPAGTTFYAELSINAAFSPLAASSATLNAFATFAGPLSANTTYFARVKALGAGGIFSAYGPSASTSTLALPPAAGSPSFAAILLDGFTLQWAANGDPGGTVYRAEVSTAPGFVPLTASSATTGTSVAFSGLTFATTYFAHVRAENNDSPAIPTAFVSLGSTQTLDGGTGGIAAGGGGTVSVPTSFGTIDLQIPAGSFPVPVDARVTVLASAPPPLSDDAVVTPIGQSVDISFNGLQPAKLVTITLPYRASDAVGHTQTRFVIARHDDVRNRWAPLPSTADPASRTVTAQTSHFSTFQVMQVDPAVDLSAVKVYPNPFRPGQNAGAVSLTNMPAGASVRVFTALGQQLSQLTASGTGVATWDGRNAWGQNVASGLYLAMIESGGQRKVVKVVIER